MIRVGLFDDQELIRDGLTAILASAEDMRVVLAGADGSALVRAVRHGVGLDVALVDIRMPGMDGLEATRQATALPNAPAVVLLTTFDEYEYVLQALQAGAVGFLLKRCTRGDLLSGVRAAAAGDAILSPGVTRTVIRRMLPAYRPCRSRRRSWLT